MAHQPVDIGSAPNARDGEPLRTAFEKVNSNDAELYSRVGSVEANKQPLDASLTALAALNWQADTYPYGVGADSLLLGTITAFGRSLIDDSNAANARTTLGALALAGDTMTGLLTLSGDPSSALHAATKQYVDNTAAGLDVKPSVRNATTANVTLSGEQTIDGILTATSRILVKNQTAPAENGIYVTAAGAWARATDMDAWTEVPGAMVWVEQGTANADTAWVATADAGGTIGVTSITWSQFGGTGAFAPLASPAFTGNPTAPTAAPGDNDTSIATTAFVAALGALRVATVKVQSFTASGTYTPAAGILYALMFAVGGGAGGGGANSTVANSSYGGSGGGAGSLAIKIATAADIGASLAVTIGAGGNGGAAGSNDGVAGGDTSIGAICIGKGGGSGKFGALAQLPVGGTGGVAGTGTITPTGAPGHPGFIVQTTNSIMAGGNGGSSIFGGGGRGGYGTSGGAGAAGGNAGNYGSGGGGGSVNQAANTAAGGNGSGGIAWVLEFCNQ